MTPANQKRVRELARRLKDLAKENPDAESSIYDLLNVQRTILDIVDDLVFRPEANA